MQVVTVINVQDDPNDMKENEDKKWISVVVDVLPNTRTDIAVDIHRTRRNNKIMSSVSVFFIFLCIFLAVSVLLLVLLRTFGNKNLFKSFVLPTLE